MKISVMPSMWELCNKFPKYLSVPKTKMVKSIVIEEQEEDQQDIDFPIKDTKRAKHRKQKAAHWRRDRSHKTAHWRHVERLAFGRGKSFGTGIDDIRIRRSKEWEESAIKDVSHSDVFENFISEYINEYIEYIDYSNEEERSDFGKILSRKIGDEFTFETRLVTIHK